MPRVFNLKCEKVPPGAVYIGRGKNSPWGNRYVIGRDGSRADVIRKFTEEQLPELLPRIHLLRGKDLACFCAPEDCHGDVLLAVANVPLEEGYPVGTLDSFRNWPYVAGLICEELFNYAPRTFGGFLITKPTLLANHGIQANFVCPPSDGVRGLEVIDGEERIVVLFGSTEFQAYTSVEFRDVILTLMMLGD